MVDPEGQIGMGGIASPGRYREVACFMYLCRTCPHAGVGIPICKPAALCERKLQK